MRSHLNTAGRLCTRPLCSHQRLISWPTEPQQKRQQVPKVWKGLRRIKEEEKRVEEKRRGKMGEKKKEDIWSLLEFLFPEHTQKALFFLYSRKLKPLKHLSMLLYRQPWTESSLHKDTDLCCRFCIHKSLHNVDI